MTATRTAPKKGPGRRPKVVLRPSLGAEVCAWIETFLCHGPGDVQGEPLVLDDEFRAFLWRCYEVFPKGHAREGRRSYHQAFLSRPKGRAKSELAAAIACVEALGPVRFDGWDAKGWPVGRPVTYPVVRCFATEEGQAGNTYDGVLFMLENGPIASDSDFDGLDLGATRINLPDGGQIKAVSSGAASKDGGKDTFNVFDEVHLWTTPELHRLYNTVTRNLGKRMRSEGWSLVTSTMYGLGEGSVAEGIHERARLSPEAGLLFDHREAPADVDLDDDGQILEALRHVYGAAADWMDLEALIDREFHDPSKSEADNRRYWFNQPVKLAGRMVDPVILRGMEDAGRVVKDGTRVVLGFDGSKNRDGTVLVGWTVEDVPHLFAVRVWTRPDNAVPDWRVPRLEVDDQVRRCFERFDVARMVCDPAYWDSEIEEWAAEFGDDRVIVLDTNQPSKMGPAVRRFQMALRERSFTWDGNEVLYQHLVNGEIAESARWGSLLVKPDGRQSQKIDGAVAAVIGYSELQHLPVGPGERAAREWLESLVDPRETVDPSDAPVGPEPPAPSPDGWSPWAPAGGGPRSDQTKAALDMLRQMPPQMR